MWRGAPRSNCTTPPAPTPPSARRSSAWRSAKAARTARSAAGLPVFVLPDEMLLDDEYRVRALLSASGNPANAWPDQQKAVKGLRSLDLLVQIDPWMSETAQLAHYVLPPKMAYETPCNTS